MIRKMKLGGLHMHMVLVIAMICVIIYVFYISKDIMTLDKEVRVLKVKLQTMEQMQQQQTLSQLKSVSIPQQQQQPKAEVIDITEEDLESVDSEKIKSMLNNESEIDELEKANETAMNENVVVQDESVDYHNLSWNELKQVCKDKGLTIKGFSKEQLIEKLTSL